MPGEDTIAIMSARISSAALRCERLPFEVARVRMRELEAECCAQFSDTRLLADLKRSIAQHLFRTSIINRLPPNVCKEQYYIRASLGWYHVTDKCRNAVILARRYVGAAAKQDAIELIEGILKEMREAGQEDELTSQMFQETKTFLDEVKTDAAEGL